MEFRRVLFRSAIAEIPGTDKKDEVIMLGGHLDSWHSATGATDNAIGCATMMEAARILKALGIHLRQSGEIFSRMLARPGAMLAGVALSIASLAAHFLGYWLSSCAFGAGLNAGTIFSIMPVVDTLTMIPVALYGLGLREALFNALLGEFYGVPAGTATLVSLGGFTAQAIVALSGIVFLPFVKFLRLAGREG